MKNKKISLNKIETFVLYLCILIIIVSLVLIGFKLTGKVTDTDTAIVNVTIESSIAINFTTDLVDFGSGQVNLGQMNATVNTIGESLRGNWTAPTDGFVLENMGNLNVTLDLEAGKTATTFLGGTNPEYKFNVTNIETGSCSNVSFLLSDWFEVNGSAVRICDVFAFGNDYDTIRIDISLTIPSDSFSGEQTDTFTATATAI
jgi:hypothetical protein